MVKITGRYEGNLHCELVHGPSKAILHTDAPKDNQGKGEAFSPTDLVAASLLSCMLTTMGIVAKKLGIAIEGIEGSVEKEMVADPIRRITKLTIVIRMTQGLSKENRKILEETALECPVTKSLGERVETPTTFTYPD